MSDRVITVFGATGDQGGSVARALLQQGGWKVRGITRNPDSDKAKSLKDLGAEMVKASLDDKESLKAAIRGSYGVFLVTNFWEFVDMARETKQGKDAADVCREEGVKHLVYSGLAPTERLSGILVPHMQSKGDVEDYLPTLGVPYTIVRYPFYYENIIKIMAQKQEDGTFSLALPMGKHPLYGLSVGDGGPAVAAIFQKSGEYAGKIVGLAGEHSPVEQYAATITKNTSKTFNYIEVTEEAYAGFGFPGADDLALMFKFFKTDAFQRDVALTKKLNPKTQSFEEYVKANKDKFDAL